MKVGLTGGIASGKTTVAEFLRAWGAEVIDSDQLAHDAIAPGQPAYQNVVEQFGRGILNADGSIDRQRLGEIVFQDDAQRERLNQIVHPRVRAEWQRRSAEAEAAAPGKVVVAMIPLLYETQAEKAFDAVVVVGCRQETQRERMASRGLNQRQIDARLRAQLPIPSKLERADFVLWNEYSLAILEQQARMVWERLSREIQQRRN